MKSCVSHEFHVDYSAKNLNRLNTFYVSKHAQVSITL